ncbi:MAG: response regulator [Ruminococcus sp.]
MDIVITDIKMPAADGPGSSSLVHENHPMTKVIIPTGYADFEYAQTAIKYHVTSFILKSTNKKNFPAVQEAQKQLIVSQQQENIAKEGVFFLERSADAGAD